MADLLWQQYALIAAIFVWSGFVRSGLGFGGAVLALPFLLLIRNDPLVFLPILAMHLMIFSGWITWRSHRSNQATLHASGEAKDDRGTIDWKYLIDAMKIMIVPKIIGVLGLLTLPTRVMSTIIFGIVICYAIGYVLNRPFRSNSRALDIALLVLGGYVSGASLIGAPLLIAVFASHVAREQLRDTLFVLWFILVVIKMASFVIAGVDLQLIHHLWLLPCAFIGHLLGERFHRRIVAVETPVFFRILGSVLIVVSLIGIFWPPA